MRFIKTIDNLPWILKLLLCLPIVDIVWGLYRIVKGTIKKDTTLIVAGAVWILLGGVILWLVDLVSIIMWKDIKILA